MENLESSISSFSDSSSLDVISELDFEFDEDFDFFEPHPLTVKKKRKKRKKKRRRRRKSKRTIKEKSAPIAPSVPSAASVPSEPSVPSVPAEELVTSDTKPKKPESLIVRDPILDGLLESWELEGPEDAEKKDVIVEEGVDDIILKATKVFGPEPVGINTILMKRRRAKEVEEKRLPPPPPPIVEEGSTVSDKEPAPAAFIRPPKPKPPKFISCKFINPGPGQYEYYSSVGYEGHDPTRKRAPGFSFGRKMNIPKKRLGPGPKYNIRGFTMEGKDKPVTHTFGKKQPVPEIEVTPGPSDYKDQSLYLAKRSQSAVLYGRREEVKGFQTPGAVGELIYMGSNKPAACLLGKPKAPKPSKFPSPLSYAPVRVDVYKKRSPSFTMAYNRKPPKTDADFFPTVGSYSPNYDYFLKKRNVVIPTGKGNCIRVPLDLPEKNTKK